MILVWKNGKQMLRLCYNPTFVLGVAIFVSAIPAYAIPGYDTAGGGSGIGVGSDAAVCAFWFCFWSMSKFCYCQRGKPDNTQEYLAHCCWDISYVVGK